MVDADGRRSPGCCRTRRLIDTFMPPLTRWFIKVAMVYLAAALLIGLALTIRPLLTLLPFVGALSPVYFHLFLVGWVTQLIFGVVYWMFPKFTNKQPHSSEAGWQATFWLLNIGLLLRVIFEPLQTLQSGLVWSWLVALSAFLQWLAGLIFVIITWGRVKER
jgi:cbb3-type cytochrome oxidase subunit 1